MFIVPVALRSKAVPLAAKPAIAMLAIAAVLAPAPVAASDAGQLAVIAAPAGGGLQLTGKERLGEKWRDEQRIDNCT